jgi:hypothetical protein
LADFPTEVTTLPRISDLRHISRRNGSPELRLDERLGYFKYWNRVRFCTLAKDSSAACSAVTPSL